MAGLVNLVLVQNVQFEFSLDKSCRLWTGSWKGASSPPGHCLEQAPEPPTAHTDISPWIVVIGHVCACVCISDLCVYTNNNNNTRVRTLNFPL